MLSLKNWMLKVNFSGDEEEPDYDYAKNGGGQYDYPSAAAGEPAAASGYYPSGVEGPAAAAASDDYADYDDYDSQPSQVWMIFPI